MGEAGFEIFSPEEFLTVLDNEYGGNVETLLDSERRMAVHLVGSELSRGRGGPRCLTCPVEREA